MHYLFSKYFYEAFELFKDEQFQCVEVYFSSVTIIINKLRNSDLRSRSKGTHFFAPQFWSIFQLTQFLNWLLRNCQMNGFILSALIVLDLKLVSSALFQLLNRISDKVLKSENVEPRTYLGGCTLEEECMHRKPRSSTPWHSNGLLEWVMIKWFAPHHLVKKCMPLVFHRSAPNKTRSRKTLLQFPIWQLKC